MQARKVNAGIASLHLTQMLSYPYGIVLTYEPIDIQSSWLELLLIADSVAPQ